MKMMIIIETRKAVDDDEVRLRIRKLRLEHVGLRHRQLRPGTIMAARRWMLAPGRHLESLGVVALAVSSLDQGDLELWRLSLRRRKSMAIPSSQGSKPNILRASREAFLLKLLARSNYCTR